MQWSCSVAVSPNRRMIVTVGLPLRNGSGFWGEMRVEKDANNPVVFFKDPVRLDAAEMIQKPVFGLPSWTPVSSIPYFSTRGLPLLENQVWHRPDDLPVAVEHCRNSNRRGVRRHAGDA